MTYKKIILWVVIIVVVLAGGYYFFRRNAVTYKFVQVTEGSIAETVSITGNTAPVSSVSLGFGNSGIISNVYSEVGKRVSAGSLLATLDMGDLFAQEKQAEANVDIQKAKLQGLEAGSRPEDINISEAQLSKSKQDLSNMYASVSTTLSSGLNSATDAVYTQLISFFSNGDVNPQINFSSSDSQAVVNSTTKRLTVGKELQNWRTEISTLSQVSPVVNLDNAIKNALAHLVLVQDFLNSVSSVTNSAQSLPSGVASLSALKILVTTAVTEVNTAVANINTASQNIASQKLTVAGLQAELDLKKAGTSAQDISAQEAQVAQAEAAVLSIQAKLRNSEIVAPQAGVITVFDAKIGQTATLGSPLISIISDSSFEIDATVSEIDVGKITLGNKINMTLDAFPHETFTGSIFYIDPAQTNNQGVVGYKIKASFDKPDPRMKSGLTVNMNIETRRKDGVLVLPQYAILQNDQGTFVEVLENKTVKQIPVTLGIADQVGNVEVLSGVLNREQVLNIGLKR